MGKRRRHADPVEQRRKWDHRDYNEDEKALIRQGRFVEAKNSWNERNGQ